MDIERIQITATNTDKVPNTSPTAASSGADLNGKAAQNAAQTIKQRLVEFAARKGRSSRKTSNSRTAVRLRDHYISFEELIQQAYFGGLAVLHRLLPHAEDLLRPQSGARAAVLLLRLWRGLLGSDRRYPDRRIQDAAQRHPA